MIRLLIAVSPFIVIASILAVIALIAAAYGWHDATLFQRLAEETRR